MNRREYKEKSITAEGRKNLHNELISEIRSRIDSLVSNAPEANKDKVRGLFDKAMVKIEGFGNSMLFDFFASDECSDRDFIRYIQQVIAGKF